VCGLTHLLDRLRAAANDYYNTLRIANRYYGEGVQESESIGHPLSLIILNKLGYARERACRCLYACAGDLL
jgi:hypothetical protein